VAAAVVRVALSAESEEVKHLINADQLAGHLRTVDFLAALDPKQIEVVAQGARIEQFLSGERVVHQNESGDELYIILSGSADVQIELNDLHSVVNHLSSGQFFGEMSLLTGEPRSATVVATSCLRVIVVGKESLIRVAKEDHPVIEQIGETVTTRHASTAAAKQQLSRDAALRQASCRHARSSSGSKTSFGVEQMHSPPAFQCSPSTPDISMKQALQARLPGRLAAHE
jgi:CRP-like cAMP-binding protein